MPIPATNIKTISKIDSFRFIKFSFSACFCSVVIILYFAVQGNISTAQRFVRTVGAFIGRPQVKTQLVCYIIVL